MRFPARAAMFDLHGVRQQGVRLAGGTVQGPATRAGLGCLCLKDCHQDFTLASSHR